ncbi:hypothetical protein ACIGNX_01420 [Actinosynnema sp. NPDC053489]|uniref:hypothetical protein n=1 Tax=Actinosynnema sp. NPDC053489 TaxID=3363916 RepID=UPI0037CAA188
MRVRGVYGIGVASSDLDILWNLDQNPQWLENRWVPVAGDGLGDQCLVVCGDSHLPGGAIIFIDVAEDPNAASYLVASNLLRFLRFLFEKELGVKGWPFDEGFVISADPEIGEMGDRSLLPWNR